MSAIVAVYCDGGVIQRNPSTLGGTWAWCAVDAADTRVQNASGLIAAPMYGAVTNNQTELWAALQALQAMPEGWSGQLCSDSRITLGRLCNGWRLDNIPRNWHAVISDSLRRVGTITPILLDGHPTRAELVAGVGKRGHPVSCHNVWCDLACNREATAYLTRIEGGDGRQHERHNTDAARLGVYGPGGGGL